jgi:uncharacterized tellurite resistance protein B-like protein|tara:strand:- start:104 stop:532 length:429 start_codon:yes stop_codon:yes gene_type:complete
MINIFKKKNDKEIKKDEKFLNIAALLIHVAKIDENYTEKEKEIIKRTIEEISDNNINAKNIIEDAEKLDNDSNQILDFTKTVKNLEENLKIKLIETLWRIIYSDKNVDLYEASLMRRLAGLLYIDSKTLGDIKNKIYNENLK